MGKNIISKKTRLELREHLVGWTLREIGDEFAAADIACDTAYQPPEGGARRSLVEQYYRTLDFARPADVQKFLRVFENVLGVLEDRQRRDTEAGQAEARLAHETLVCWIAKDGFEYRAGKLIVPGSLPGFQQLKSIAVEFNAAHLAQQIQRMEQAAESDPRLAIGTAKELVETTCKTILTERGVAYDAGWDLSELVKHTRRELQLLPEDIPEEKRASDIMRRILSNFAALTQGLGELRNLYGTGHGPEGRARGLQPRHARLAVGAAAALATFLFETHQQRQSAPERS